MVDLEQTTIRWDTQKEGLKILVVDDAEDVVEAVRLLFSLRWEEKGVQVAFTTLSQKNGGLLLTLDLARPHPLASLLLCLPGVQEVHPAEEEGGLTTPRLVVTLQEPEAPATGGTGTRAS